MKNLILTFAFILISLYTNAQGAMIVNDPMANESLITSIAQGAEQVRNGLEQLEYLKKAKEVVEKVSNVVRDVKEIEEIYGIQKQLLSNSSKQLRELQQTKMFRGNEMSNIATSYNNLIDNSIKTLETLDKILSNNLFKMNDGERLKFIRELKEEMQVKLADTDVLYNKYLKIAQGRALGNLFKKSN